MRDDHGARVAERYGIRRSPHWRVIAALHLKRQPFCVACGPYSRHFTKKQVHHIFPFHYVIRLGRPDLELDDRNLITLCESGPNHHLLLGHLDDFESANLFVIRHARRTFHAMTAPQLEASRAWESLVSSRLPHLEKLTHVERADCRARMDAIFPHHRVRP
jgi:hypothetical protein